MDVTPESAPDKMTDTITIRPLTTAEECDYFQAVEHIVWGSEDSDVVPTHVLVTVAKNGGLVLGAFAPDGPQQSGGLVGIALGWLGTGVDPATPNTPPKIKFCSHMAGVAPTWQGKHVGLRLKLAQRDFVLAQGITGWMTWTYDPLFRANAVFNIHRLGATCATYMRNIYGVMTDDLNRGVPSDRCQVDWRIASAHVRAKLQEEISPNSPHAHWDAAYLEILPSTVNASGFAVPGEPVFVGDGRPLAISIPSDITAIRRSDHELSLAWRYYLRTILEGAFAEGYTMVDCIHLNEHGWRYILVREYS
jgi:predicted GNAT superfamily acetyltransferase